MVHWVWVIVALFGGALAGILSSALCVMSSGPSIQDEMERETCCGNCKAGCTD